MANNDNRSNQSQQNNEDWAQNNERNRSNYGNIGNNDRVGQNQWGNNYQDTGHGDFGKRQYLGNKEGYGSYYNRTNYMPDYNQDRGVGNSGHQRL